MKHRILQMLALAALTGSASAAPSAPSPAERTKPNILVIVADDLGYADVGFQGCIDVPTPNLDALARDGVRFTNGYITAPTCCPSRAGLLAGRNGTRFGFETNIGGNPKIADSAIGIPVTEKIMPERFKAAGYTTGAFGKWHVGYAPELQPTQRGFDWYYGYLQANRSYTVSPGEMGKSLLPESSKPTGYATDMLAAEASAFIAQNRDKPWMVYLAFSAVHASPDGGKRLVDADAGRYAARFPEIANEQRRIFAGMMSAMDDGVGVVMNKLRELNLEENTVVFFISDNGGPTAQNTSSNEPLSGGKGKLSEGGIRVPFVLQWKGHLPGGKVDARPVSSLDIQPTALAAAGAPIDSILEGTNLLPYLSGEKSGDPHDFLAWRMFKQRALRQGDWKILDRGDGWKLYNLAADIAEEKDASKSEPARFQELMAAYARWDASNVPAKWAEHGRRGDSE